MEEKIIANAEISTQNAEKKSNNTKQNSMVGVLIPLFLPACILLYMFVEELKFSDLDGVTLFIFFAPILFSLFLYYCHSKLMSNEKEKITQATDSVAKQSLIITDKRIYGLNKNSNFSYKYCDITKAYISQIAGQSPTLTIKLSNDDQLEFEHISNQSIIVAHINDLMDKTKQQVNTTNNTPIVTESTEHNETPNPTYKNDIECELFDVVITSAAGNISQIKTIRQITLMDLASAKNVFFNLPYTLTEGKNKNEALKIKGILESAGMTVVLNKNSQ